MCELDVEVKRVDMPRRSLKTYHVSSKVTWICRSNRFCELDVEVKRVDMPQRSLKTSHVRSLVLRKATAGSAWIKKEWQDFVEV